MTIESQMQNKLEAAFAPSQLRIVNESHKHAHHAPMQNVADKSETHFAVFIVSERFGGCNRVQRHRMVHEVLAEELRGGVHALSVQARTPEEAA